MQLLRRQTVCIRTTLYICGASVPMEEDATHWSRGILPGNYAGKNPGESEADRKQSAIPVELGIGLVHQRFFNRLTMVRIGAVNFR